MTLVSFEVVHGGMTLLLPIAGAAIASGTFPGSGTTTGGFVVPELSPHKVLGSLFLVPGSTKCEKWNVECGMKRYMCCVLRET